MLTSSAKVPLGAIEGSGTPVTAPAVVVPLVAGVAGPGSSEFMADKRAFPLKVGLGDTGFVTVTALLGETAGDDAVFGTAGAVEEVGAGFAFVPTVGDGVGLSVDAAPPTASQKKANPKTVMTIAQQFLTVSFEIMIKYSCRNRPIAD
jgi:hypothetical protein